jgi:competence protein ComEA
MERLPAGWTSVDAVGDGGVDDEEGADPEDGGEAVAAARGASAASPHRQSIAIFGGLAGIVVAAALVVLASGTPRPTVTIGGEPEARPVVGAAASASASARATRSPGSAGASAGGGAEVVVDVEGAVARPGVYHLPGGSRLADALRAAGGFSAAVDVPAVEQDLNLATTVTDGAKVRVPALGETTTGTPVGSGIPATAAAAPVAGALIDLNHASAEQLDTLPGVGPATAAKIIAAREERPFATVDELDDRGVLGPSTLAKLRDLVTVGP